MLSPVPTAVPPIASSDRCFKELFIVSIPWSICETYPENSCPNVIGVASIICVLPILTIFLNCLDFFSKLFLNFFKLGTVLFLIMLRAAILIAVGKVSFDDWDLFTSSLGDSVLLSFTKLFFSIIWALLVITSLTFMLVCVPDPVCQITRGNWSSCSPLKISLHTLFIRFNFFFESIPRSKFEWAADFFIKA